MRGQGEGSVYKDARGYWTGSVELPRINGERRRKVIRRKDKKQLLRDLAAMRAEFETRGDLPTHDQTVSQWFAYWLTVVVREVRPKTFDGYRAVTKHITDAIGKVKLEKVTGATVRRVHEHMEGLGHSSTYQLLAHRVMSVSFKQAVRENRIGRNPTDLTKAPRRRVAQLEALDLNEALQVIKAVQDDPDGARWIMHLLTGARRGEVIGLEVDRVTDVLDFSWQLMRLAPDAVIPTDFERRHLAGGLWLTRPKSKAGYRVVPLVEPLKSVLERHMANAEPNPWGLVFAQKAWPFDPDAVSGEWQDVLKRVGIDKKIRLHDLRHTAVDLLLLAGVPEDVVMEIVGHSTRATTRAYKSRNSPRVRAAMLDYAALFTQDADTPRALEG